MSRFIGLGLKPGMTAGEDAWNFGIGKVTWEIFGMGLDSTARYVKLLRCQRISIGQYSCARFEWQKGRPRHLAAETPRDITKCRQIKEVHFPNSRPMPRQLTEIMAWMCRCRVLIVKWLSRVKQFEEQEVATELKTRQVNHTFGNGALSGFAGS
jgi:hypothetical protein